MPDVQRHRLEEAVTIHKGDARNMTMIEDGSCRAAVSAG